MQANLKQADIHAFLTSALFEQVQKANLFGDGKTFADAVLLTSWREIQRAYSEQKPESESDVRTFVSRYFALPDTDDSMPEQQASDLLSHIKLMWQTLQRQADTDTASTLLPLQSPYIVPGGRFREIYYWDTYFTALGLMIDDQPDLVLSMVNNFLDLQNRLPCIPNGNRLYYISRSQPPVLSMMLDLLLESDRFFHEQKESLRHRALPMLEKEYNFWMQGHKQLTEDTRAIRRVVRMPDGSVLNRYWDDSDTPRAESLREDIELAHQAGHPQQGPFMRHIRAACESGWDFSSRWLKDPSELASIRTTDILPVDLNCLLWKLESSLDTHFTHVGEKDKASHYRHAAARRQQAINTHMWNNSAGFYHDIDWQQGKQTKIFSLAATVPLFFGLASPEQAASVKTHIETSFLKAGGLVTTLTASEQQWDSPNGWAPLQWFAVIGLEQYGFSALAHDIMTRWVATVENVYLQHHCIMEKYNVVASTHKATGGEYTVQTGFGWTNGVTRAFMQKLAT